MDDEEIDQIMQSQPDDFTRWQADVERQLRDGDLIKDPPGPRLLQYLELPSVGAPAAWDIFTAKRGTEYSLIKTSNNLLVRVRLDKDTFDRLYGTLCSAKLSLLLPSSEAGLDGTSYELAFGDYRLSWRVRWWGELPAEWSDLKAALAPLVTYLRERIEHVTAI